MTGGLNRHWLWSEGVAVGSGSSSLMALAGQGQVDLYAGRVVRLLSGITTVHAGIIDRDHTG